MTARPPSDSPAGRVYHPEHLLSSALVGDVLREFRAEVPRFFGDGLCFGFVFGGFAKGYAVRDQDVDMFICVERVCEEAVTAFREWYFALHQRHELTPDRRDPGEMMTAAFLDEKLRFVAGRPLRPIIETFYEYEGIVWADAITGPRAAVIGDPAALEARAALCEALPQRWRSELLTIAGTSVDLETAKLPVTRLFRRFVTYQKQGDNTCPAATE